MGTNKILKRLLGERPKKKDWLFKDTDGDGVVNFEDCEPNNPDEQGIIHEAAKKVVEYKDKGIEKARKGGEAVRNYATKGEFRADTQAEIDARAEKRRVEEQSKQAEFEAYKARNIAQERAEKVEEQTAKELYKDAPVRQTIYTGFDKARDLGQTVVRGGTEMFKYSDRSDVYDYTKSAGYKEIQRQKQSDNAFVRTVATGADYGQQVGEGVTRAIPGVPDARYSTENLKNRPGVVAGQLGGELLMWRGAGKVAAKTIGSTGKLSRTAADTNRAFGVRAAAKAGELGTRGTGKLLASKPVRIASEGRTGEAVDVTQAYFGQSSEIDAAIMRGDFKEVGGRLAAGYAFEKAGDKAVSSGFRSGIVKGPSGKPDVDKFISESGDDPKIARLFQVEKPKKLTVEEQLKLAKQKEDADILLVRQGQTKTFADKLEEVSGIDFRKADTRVDPRVLQGTRPVRGGEWNLKGVETRGDVGGPVFKPIKPFRVEGQRGFKGEKADKQERQERQERQEKLEKLTRGERADKQVKGKIFDSFAMPVGGQNKDWAKGAFSKTRSKKRTSNILDFASSKKKFKGKWI